MVAVSSLSVRIQLAESTDGGRSPTCGKMARSKNATHPASESSVKYTLILQPCATAATTPTSSVASITPPPKGGPPVTSAALFVWPNSPMSVSTGGVFEPAGRLAMYLVMSECRYAAPSSAASNRPIVCPTADEVGKLYSCATVTGDKYCAPAGSPVPVPAGPP